MAMAYKQLAGPSLLFQWGAGVGRDIAEMNVRRGSICWLMDLKILHRGKDAADIEEIEGK